MTRENPSSRKSNLLVHRDDHKSLREPDEKSPAPWQKHLNNSNLSGCIHPRFVICIKAVNNGVN
jgi:hypothetical protein